MIENVATLLIWWSIWTLFDAYLIQFTPTSELVILAIAVLLLYFSKARSNRKKETLVETAQET